MGELVALDGFPLSGNTRDGIWKINSLAGWNQRPSVRRNNQSRARGDGSYKTAVYYDNRLITINGRLFAKSHENLHQAEGILNSLGQRGDAQLLVGGHGPTQWATVDPRDSPELTIVTDKFLQFQIPLEAIDPFKYGEWRKFAASVGSDVAVFHRGNADAIPYVVVSGSMPGGYTLSHAGSSVVVTEPLVSGSPHTVDYRKRRLYKGGAPVRGGLSTASYARVAPGQRDTFSVTPNTTGTATATMTLYDTYI